MAATALIVLFGEDDNDYIRGGSGADTLVGGDGDDQLFDGDWLTPDNDTLIGGKGDNYYVISSIGDMVIEHADASIDTVSADLDVYVLPENVENLRLHGSTWPVVGPVHGTGNELDNEMSGAANANSTLLGLGGDDTLLGGFGDDTLDGGEGDDALYGAFGNETMNGGAGE